MHPAVSVIAFTTLAGTGYGLLILFGLAAAMARAPGGIAYGLVAVALGLALATAGLLASTAHLGHKERAWRAFSQWRSSWLSREGVAAIATYLPAGALFLGWIWLDPGALALQLLGLAMAAFAAVTVWCTAMIYRSLKPIHQWHNHWVVPNYFALALMTGALWLAALTRLIGEPAIGPELTALAAIGVAAAAKLGYWRFIDTTRSPASAGSATGLGARGTVRLLEPPHAEDNYLMKEMGYRIARKHAGRLRAIALALGFALPALAVLVALALGGAAAGLIELVAALAAMAGVLVERWLFFAEARHTVTLYYGATTA